MSVTDAEAQLTDLVRRAEAGDDVVLTRHGRPAVRLVPIKAAADMAKRAVGIDRAIELARATAFRGPDYPDAARSQDFLYDKDGLPG